MSLILHIQYVTHIRERLNDASFIFSKSDINHDINHLIYI